MLFDFRSPNLADVSRMRKRIAVEDEVEVIIFFVRWDGAPVGFDFAVPYRGSDGVERGGRVGTQLECRTGWEGDEVGDCAEGGRELPGEDFAFG